MPNEGRGGGHMAIRSAKSVKFHKGEDAAAADGGLSAAFFHAGFTFRDSWIMKEKRKIVIGVLGG